MPPPRAMEDGEARPPMLTATAGGGQEASKSSTNSVEPLGHVNTSAFPGVLQTNPSEVTQDSVAMPNTPPATDPSGHRDDPASIPAVAGAPNAAIVAPAAIGTSDIRTNPVVAARTAISEYPSGAVCAKASLSLPVGLLLPTTLITSDPSLQPNGPSASTCVPLLRPNMLVMVALLGHVAWNSVRAAAPPLASNRVSATVVTLPLPVIPMAFAEAERVPVTSHSAHVLLKRQEPGGQLYMPDTAAAGTTSVQNTTTNAGRVMRGIAVIFIVNSNETRGAIYATS